MRVGRNGRLGEIGTVAWADCEPSNEKAQLDYHATNVNRSMFGSDDGDDLPSPGPSPIVSPARIYVRSDDDAVSHRG